MTTLALVQAYPGLVSTAVPHEPPVSELLADRAEQRETAAEIIPTYVAGDRLAAWRKFMANSKIFIPEEVQTARDWP
ncbi:hypothetical protein [Nocardia sp. GAS34]|uniref:hypothetical protein n=1 Tax=unclassified Nocardia TaxID=2637762 RepID=UPI003D1A53BE